MGSELDAVRAALLGAGKWPIEDVVLVDAAGGFVQRNYVLLFPNMPRFESERHTQVARASGRRDVDVAFKAVGVTAGAVGDWLERVSALVGDRLLVTGRQCGPLEVGSERGVQHDSSVKPGLFFVDGWVRFTSRPV